MKNDNKNNTNIFNYIPKKYSSYVFDATTKYQKKYGFDMGSGKNPTPALTARRSKVITAANQIFNWLKRKVLQSDTFII